MYNKQNVFNKPSRTDMPDFLEEAFVGVIGMDSVKEELMRFYNLVRVENLRVEKLGLPANKDRAFNFILYGNPGTGKTTVARIIGKVLYCLGIRKKEVVVEVDRSKLVGQYIGDTAPLTMKAIDSARGGTLFIDEAYSLYVKGSDRDFGMEAIDTLLKDMEDKKSEYTVIMAGYRDKMTEMLNHTNPGFRSRFTFHIDIPDYSDDELIQIAHSIANKHHYKIDSSAEIALRKRINRERIDETFGNARFIREVVNEAQARLADRFATKKTGIEDDLILLLPEDFYPLDDDSASLDELLNTLNSLTGLSDVKRYVTELKDKITVQREAEKRGIIIKSGQIQSMHMTFKGNAGTGKTTVARLIGRIFGEMGVLKRGNVFVECTREDVVGQYQGHTAEKMRGVIRSALGGVLFIDEAYSLKYGDGDNFGQEAITTLVAAMENYRDSLVVILAGYTSDLDQFLQANQGLRSRIAHHLIFEDYSLEEMVDIFYHLAETSDTNLDEGLREAVKSIITINSKSTDFGNARGVRNLFEAAVRKKESRIAKMLSAGESIKDDDFNTLLLADIESVQH